MNMKISAALSALALTALTSLAYAQAPEDRREGGRAGAMFACKSDLASYCPGVEAGGGRKMRCLQEHSAKLAPDCRTIVESRLAGKGPGGPDGRRSETAPPAGGVAVPAAPPAAVGGPPPPATAPPGPVGAGKGAKSAGRGGAMAACRTDVATHCQSAGKGEARRACLKQNHARLSPECQAAIGQMQVARKVMTDACRADAASLCAGIEKGGGRLVQCLARHKAQLSPGCATAAASMPAFKRM